jgi:adenine phosphoribosyltransferase
MERLARKIRAIPDFPKPGMVFRDITPLVKDPAALRLAVLRLMYPFLGEEITAVAGLEAKGFIFGSLLAWELGVGFIPVRKPGKLPFKVQSTADVDYGAAPLEMHADAVKPGDRILLVDDLIATGDTAAASCEMMENTGVEIVACAFIVELDSLRGRQRLAKYRVYSLVHY